MVLDVPHGVSLIHPIAFDLVLLLVVLLVADSISFNDPPILPYRVGRLVVLDIPD